MGRSAKIGLGIKNSVLVRENKEQLTELMTLQKVFLNYFDLHCISNE